MSYIICKHPACRIDLMVLENYWPQLASYVERCDCTYFKEDHVELPGGDKYVILRDVRSFKAYMVGELMKLFFKMESENPESEDGKQKFYILIKPRKKGKKIVSEDRTETDAGSEGGDSGESGDIHSGECVDGDTDGDSAVLLCNPVAEQLSIDFEEVSGIVDDQ